jgi:hypothetical protein
VPEEALEAYAILAAMGPFHLGFERSELQTLLAAAGFVGLDVTTATITRKENRDYPVFLITGRRPA